MVRRAPFVLAAVLTIAAGCSSDRRSSAGFRLPPGGDADRGRTAFVALECHTCHTISGLDLPRPANPSPAPVVLGGTVIRPPNDGALVTSIINPSDQLARYPARDIPASGKSRMPHYADRMTVQQMTDIVAFLHAQYKERPPAPISPY